MKKKFKKHLILQAGSVSVASITPDAAKPATTSTSAQPQKKQSSGGGIMDALGKLLPIVLGLGGLSMLFGKGLFGFGSGRGGLFGGFWGKLIGGTVLATVLPSLWSGKGIGDRLSGAFSKLTSGDWLGAIKQFFGIDSGADKAIKQNQEAVQKLATNKDNIEAKAKQFGTYAAPFAKLYNWMKNDNQIKDNAPLVYITPTVAMTLANTKQHELEKNHNKETFVALLYINDQQEASIQMAHADSLVGVISQDNAKNLKQAMTTNNLQKGLNALAEINNANISDEEWYNSAKILIDGLNTITQDDLGKKTILGLFNDGFTDLCGKQTLPTVELPNSIEESVATCRAKLQLIFEDAEENGSGLSDLLNDPELEALKEDPTLNKFDEDMKLLDEEIHDEQIKLIQMLLLNQDENGNPIYENADSCVIYGILGKEHYYYCRDRKNAYLTTDATQSVIFPGTDIKKIANESPLEVSTGEHVSIDEALPTLYKEYQSGKNEELVNAFNTYKEQHKDENKDEKILFKEFISLPQSQKNLPFKKEKRDITGNSLKEILQKFLIAVKLPQIMKIKKPGIKVNVYETNLKMVEKVKETLKNKFNVEI